MSEENVARQALRPRAQSQPALDERLCLRVPALLRLFGSAYMRLSPQSGLRRALIARRVRQIYAAFSRGDLDRTLTLATEPEIETHPALEQSGTGMADVDSVYHGRAGLVAFWERWLDPWEEYRLEPEAVFDLGARLIALLRQKGRGRGSGVELDQPMAQLITLGRYGRAVRIDVFWDHPNDLEAAGCRSSDVGGERRAS